ASRFLRSLEHAFPLHDFWLFIHQKHLTNLFDEVIIIHMAAAGNTVGYLLLSKYSAAVNRPKITVN
ncbi:MULTISPECIES: hypothetical protein, partial [Lactiplantibacillus]|uniref:hypothetical protein n=1 Tax=Lactiplantibacillus TaxID=2767842 RepID=UPI001C1F2449